MVGSLHSHRRRRIWSSENFNHSVDVFVRDRLAGVTRRVSVGPGGRQANAGSFGPAISANGRYVAFVSAASNLVAGDTTPSYDVFVRDRSAGVTRRVSVGAGGLQANGSSFGAAISPRGRYVAFISSASNLVAGDTNHASDVFLRDRGAGLTSRVSVGPGGRQANGASDSPTTAVSANGRYVAFDSFASNLVAEDTNHANDVFVRDQVVGVTRRVSLGGAGRQANDDSYSPSMSANGQYVAFHSYASNLAPNDAGRGASDVFVRDRSAQTTILVSIGRGSRQANGPSFGKAMSADGRHVTFDSIASNLVRRDTNRRSDVFVRDKFGDSLPHSLATHP